jgi:hypothetical protein
VATATTLPIIVVDMANPQAGPEEETEARGLAGVLEAMTVT